MTKTRTRSTTTTQTPETRAEAGDGQGVRRGCRRPRQTTTTVLMTVAITAVNVEAAWAASGGISEVKSFASRLTTYVTAIAASVAVLFIAVNGIRWTMSSGNPSRQAEARTGLLAAAAGLAIALSAGLIVHLVVAALR